MNFKDYIREEISTASVPDGSCTEKTFNDLVPDEAKGFKLFSRQDLKKHKKKKVNETTSSDVAQVPFGYSGANVVHMDGYDEFINYAEFDLYNADKNDIIGHKDGPKDHVKNHKKKEFHGIEKDKYPKEKKSFKQYYFG